MRRIAVLIALVLATSVLTLEPGSARPAPALFAKPRVGGCYAMTYQPHRAHPFHSRRVSCSERHTAVTVAVAKAPTSLAGLSLPQIDTIAESTCEPLLLERLGATAVRRALSPYLLIHAGPSTTQAQAGDRWVQCELALRAGTRLLPLPAHLPRPILGKRLDDRTEACLTGSHLTTPCAQRHAYRPVDAFRLEPMPYPTADELRAMQQTLCPPSTRYYRFTPEIRWQYGDRVLVCFAKTSR